MAPGTRDLELPFTFSRAVGNAPSPLRHGTARRFAQPRAGEDEVVARDPVIGAGLGAQLLVGGLHFDLEPGVPKSLHEIVERIDADMVPLAEQSLALLRVGDAEVL